MYLGSTVDGLTHFLNMHRSNLHTLQLQASQDGGLGPTSDDPNPISFDHWVRDAITGVHLTKLRVLDIRSNLFPVDTSVLCLRHTGEFRTLNSGMICT